MIHHFIIQGVFSTVLTITAYFNGGLRLAIIAAAFTYTTSLVATGIAYIKVKNNMIKSLVIPLLPGIGTIVYSASQGGVPRMFIAYTVCVCLAAVYFNKKVLLFYSSIISAIILGLYIIRYRFLELTTALTNSYQGSVCSYAALLHYIISQVKEASI
jgi:methyl-accepting chemotaxis protein